MNLDEALEAMVIGIIMTGLIWCVVMLMWAVVQNPVSFGIVIALAVGCFLVGVVLMQFGVRLRAF